MTSWTHDEDLLAATAEAACAAFHGPAMRGREIAGFRRDLLEPLAAWCRAHSNRVAACHLVVREGFVTVYVVGTSERFDLALNREAAALELDLADTGWRIGVVQLPFGDPADLKPHFDPAAALSVYAQP